MNNAVYGETMENLRNRTDVKLVDYKKDYLKWTSKPSYMLQKLLGNFLVAICKRKTTLTRNKPAYVGMCILGMYEFHYDYIKKNGIRSRLLLSDTKSLIYQIKTEDVYKDFRKAKKCFILVIIQLGQNFMKM